eukprot:TRINITY_DN3304_c0_g1_i14.p1 TRINITY_DN3304_c0_g1~~TRINITY_DN3304_c0_g1_i14.p1  ORF type:complete len:771 (+),score=116.59 TRINITY_DN3304_c0_g1_i14:44-2356(+)
MKIRNKNARRIFACLYLFFISTSLPMAFCQETGKLILFEMQDNVGDIFGLHADDVASGQMDIVSITVSAEVNDQQTNLPPTLIIDLKFRELYEPADRVYIQVYVDSDNKEGSGAIHAYKNPGVYLDHNNPWDFVIETDMKKGSVLTSTCKLISSTLKPVYDELSTTLTLKITPDILLGLEAYPNHYWKYGVFVGRERYSMFQVLWTSSDQFQPNVADVLLDMNVNQDELLSSGEDTPIPMYGSQSIAYPNCDALSLNLTRVQTLDCPTVGLGPMPWETSQCGYLLPNGRWSLGGSLFRVWAPNADSVSLMSQSLNWNPMEMNAQESGYWCLNVPGVMIGSRYYYSINYKNSVRRRLDTRSYTIERSNNEDFSLVHNPYFDWDRATYQTLIQKSDLVIYELHIGTFYKQLSSRGNFMDASRKLDYLKELGVNAIEIMPINECKEVPSWGYNPESYFAIETLYGGYEAFKSLMKECIKRDIKVILDIVYNHIGTPNIYWEYDGWSQKETGFDGDYAGGIYFYQDDRGNTEWGARPNYGRPEVVQMFLDNLKELMSEFKIAGFRWDATVCIRRPGRKCWESQSTIEEGWRFMQEGNKLISQNGGFSIAEDMQFDPRMTQSSETGGAGFHAQWEEGFYHSIKNAIVAESDDKRDINYLITKLGESAWFETRVIYSESHDKASGQNLGDGRIPYLIDPDNPQSWKAKKLSIIGLVLTLTAPGIPMLFMGQEFLESQNFRFDNTPDLNWAQVRILLRKRNRCNTIPFKSPRSPPPS